MIEGADELDQTLPPEEQQPPSGLRPQILTEDGAVETPGSLVLVRNPSWDPETDPLRAAYPDRIEFALAGLDDKEIARQVDMAEMDLVWGGSPPFEQVARYREDPELAGRVLEAPNDLGLAITLNPAVPPFDDVNVRRAVARAIDKPALAEILSHPPHLPVGHTGEIATHIAPDSMEDNLLRAFEPYPHDPEAARDEMRASAYDRTGDGRCDAPVCRDVRAPFIDEGVGPEQVRSMRDDLAEIGIDLELEPLPVEEYFDTVHDPTEKVPMHSPYPWLKDFSDGAGWFQPLFDSSGVPSPNTALLGATPSQLREWGYSVTSVPNPDARVEMCLGRRGVDRTSCWAELDQYLMTEVVTRIPYLFLDRVVVVSERVTAFSHDQFTGLVALDRVAIDPDSR